MVLLLATAIFGKPLEEFHEGTTVSSVDSTYSSTPAPVNILNENVGVTSTTELNQVAGRGAVTILGSDVSIFLKASSLRHILFRK